MFLSGNLITDISPISGLTKLTTLFLVGGAEIQDISPIGSLTNLTDLAIGGHNIADITPLANLTKLELLSIGFNKISDITPLEGLANLTYLNIQHNEVSDVSPITMKELESETKLILWGNPLSYDSLSIHIPNLQEKGIDVDYNANRIPPTDVNEDSVINILDLVRVGNAIGKTGKNIPEDVNDDKTVNILDLVRVSNELGQSAG